MREKVNIVFDIIKNYVTAIRAFNKNRFLKPKKIGFNCNYFR